MEIKFLETTKGDFRWINKYYTDVFPEGRENYLENLRKTMESLSIFPTAGRKYFDCFKKQIIKTPFAFVYYIEDETICVVRIEDNRNILNSYSRNRQRS